MTATTGQPFAHAPAHYFGDAAVPAVMQEALSGINHPDIPTIYGPVLQSLFALGYWIAPGELWPWKLALLGAEVAAVLLLGAAGVKPRWVMVFVLHPLVVKESSMTAHPDLLIGAALLAAAMAWRRSLQFWAAVLAALAVAMKISAIAVLLFFCVTREGRLSVKGTVAMLLVLGFLYAPLLLGAAPGEGGAASVFGAQWTFNPLLFKPVAAATGDGAARLICAGVFGLVWLALFGRWIGGLRNVSLNLAGRHAADQDAAPLMPIAATFTALLLLSPVVNPWYWLWALPLALLLRSCTAWTAATVSLLAYAHVGVQVMAGSSVTTYAVPLWATVVQLFATGVAFMFVARRREVK